MKSGIRLSEVFYLTDPESRKTFQLKTLESDPHKFLGCVLTYHNIPKDHLNFLKSKLTTELEKLDKTVVRPEYKVAGYTRYALPSLRYHLKVHTLHQGHLEELDMVFTIKYKSRQGRPN